MSLTMVENSNARGEQVVTISSIFTGIAFIIVALRLATRFIILRCQGPEDWMIMAALVSILPKWDLNIINKVQIGSIGYTTLVIQRWCPLYLPRLRLTCFRGAIWFGKTP